MGAAASLPQPGRRRNGPPGSGPGGSPSRGSLSSRRFFYLTYGFANWLASLARRCAGSSSSPGSARIPFWRLDDPALLVDQRLLRPVAASSARRAGELDRARPPAAHGAARSRWPASSCFRCASPSSQPGHGRAARLPVRRAAAASTSRSTRRRRCTSRCSSSSGISMRRVRPGPVDGRCCTPGSC